MRVFIMSAFSLVCSFAFGREYQTIDPDLDQEFLQKLEMYSFDSPLPLRFNILIVGQDDNINSNKKRASLGSRADILMVLSINTQNGEMDILSLYRDNPVTNGCVEKLGRYPSYGDKINGVYSVGGRAEFIPCLEGMLEERLSQSEELKDVLDDSGRFKIHSFFEGTRSHTIRPVAKDALDVVLNNKFAFTTTYGFSSLGAALDVLWQGKDLQEVLNAEEVEALEEGADEYADYLIVELKERKIYKAGGYQRAFNFAQVVATALGWTAYGIERHKNSNLDFLGYYFGDVINNNFSRSHDFKKLEEKVFKHKPNEHLLQRACFINDVSPVRVVLWSESASTYAIYQNGELSVNRKGTLLDFLKVVPILPHPPSCE